jgi:tetratricopeptide (TPR) repeat protein
MKIRLADLYNKEGMKDRAAGIYLEVAEALAIDQMHGEAAQIVERAKSMVTTPQVFLTQSRLCVIQKDLSGAAQHLREGLQANARSTELLEALAEIEIQTKNPERALEALVQIAQLPEKCLNLCERAIRDLVKAGRGDEGLRIFKPIGRDYARRGMGDSVAKIIKGAMGGQFTVEAWLQLAEIAHQMGNKGDQGQALQNAYAIAVQQRDQTLAATLTEQLRALGLTPDEAPAPGSAPPPQAYASPRATSEFTLPGVELTELDPVRRMQIQQFAREAENHIKTRSLDRAIEALKKILELDKANLDAIEKIAEIHRQSGVLSKVQMHYVNCAQVLAGSHKRLAVELLDKAEALVVGSTRLQRRMWGLTAEDLAKETTPLRGAGAAAPPPSALPVIELGPPAVEQGLPVIELGPPAIELSIPVAFEAPPSLAQELPDALIPLDIPDLGEPLPMPPQRDPFAAVLPVDLPPMEPEAPEILALPLAPLPASDLTFDFDMPDLALPPEPEPSAQTGAMPIFEAPATPSVLPAGIPLGAAEPDAPTFVPGMLAEPVSEGPQAAGPVVDDELQALLSDIDFQMDYGSPEEAKVELENALKLFPDHPELLSRLAIADEALRKLGHESHASQDHSFFDLTDVLGDGFLDAGEGEEMHDATNVVEKVQSVEELFSAFREGVENQVRGDDYDTHYNLGIAYKEMMLMEPAMEEFKKAMADPERTLECCSMLSICEMDQGNLDAALVWLNQGIEAPGFPPEDSIGLRYDKGELLSQLGRNDEARAEYRIVQEIDPDYRDVEARLA